MNQCTSEPVGNSRRASEIWAMSLFSGTGQLAALVKGNRCLTDFLQGAINIVISAVQQERNFTFICFLVALTCTQYESARVKRFSAQGSVGSRAFAVSSTCGTSQRHDFLIFPS